jgi:transcriptional regulator with XRE-family HTH domain
MIGNNVRKLRKRRGISQEKLARLADISLNTLTKIESGFAKKPTIQTVVKLAKALNVSLDDLVRNAKEKID